jgi:hypothetical protein
MIRYRDSLSRSVVVFSAVQEDFPGTLADQKKKEARNERAQDGILVKEGHSTLRDAT